MHLVSVAVLAVLFAFDDFGCLHSNSVRISILQVSTAALTAGYGAGLGLVAANRYLGFSEEPLAYATIGFTGFFYAFFSMYIYGEFRYGTNK